MVAAAARERRELIEKYLGIMTHCTSAALFTLDGFTQPYDVVRVSRMESTHLTT